MVVTEISTQGETPDAIGFDGGRSTLIECKISISDFRADAKKYFRRRPEQGVSPYRFYCTPKGLLSLSSIPPCWGLIESQGGKMFLAKKATAFSQYNYAQENRILLSVIRRIGQTRPKGVSIRAYCHETANTGSVGWMEDFLTETA